MWATCQSEPFLPTMYEFQHQIPVLRCTVASNRLFVRTYLTEQRFEDAIIKCWLSNIWLSEFIAIIYLSSRISSDWIISNPALFGHEQRWLNFSKFANSVLLSTIVWNMPKKLGYPVYAAPNDGSGSCGRRDFGCFITVTDVCSCGGSISGGRHYLRIYLV